MSGRLSHTDPRGRVRMVDVGAKAETEREAIASAAVRMSRDTLALALGKSTPGTARRRGTDGRRARSRESKGDVLATARVAAIAALKRTWELIPLCHPVRLVGTDVRIQADERLPGLRVRVTARAFDRTGVEMEAMVGAAAAALTIYDMVKGVERGVRILAVQLEEKRGGRSGVWRRGRGRVAAAEAIATGVTSPTSNTSRQGSKPGSEPAGKTGRKT